MIKFLGEENYNCNESDENAFRVQEACGRKESKMRTPKLVLTLAVFFLVFAGVAPVSAYSPTEPVNSCLMIPEAMTNPSGPGSYQPDSCLTSGSSLELNDGVFGLGVLPI